jgi:hypothetical protein
MTIRKRTGRLLLATTATTAAVAGLCAASALASTPLRATTLTVKISGGGKFTATAVKTVLTQKESSGNPVNVTCSTKGKTPASSASGNIPSGTHKGTSPVKVGTTTNLAFNNCVGPVGKVTTKVMSEPYFVAVDSKTNSKGQTDGLIGGIKVGVKMFACSFTVTGSAPGFYTNGKHTLTMAPKLPVTATTKAQLTVSKVSGCLGLVKNGDHPTFSSTFTLSRKGVIQSS